MNISVGLITDGAPLLRPSGDYQILREGNSVVYRPLNDEALLHIYNLLIGKNFHWQQTVEALLPGEVAVTQLPDGSFETVNRLPLETYLSCVIGSEMSPGAPDEFLKAHCVISRSWAAGYILPAARQNMPAQTCRENAPDTIIRWEDKSDHSRFDVCSDDHCQRYQGVPDNADKMSQIVSRTEGLVLADADGHLADTRYSKCCGGVTEIFSSCWQDTDYPYLTSHNDPYCDFSTLSATARRSILTNCMRSFDLEAAAENRWAVTVYADDIRRRLTDLSGTDHGEVRDIEVERRGPSGRAVLLRIECAAGIVHVGKELTIRRLLSEECLRSSLFDIRKVADGIFAIEGRGWGHGVGLCQKGAARMAFDGADYREILNFYFPGTHLRSISDLSK